MALVPSISPTVSPFRGASNSADYNATMRSAYNDLISAYAAIQSQVIQTQLTNEILVGQNDAALTVIASLQEDVIALRNQFAKLKTFGSSAKGASTVSLVQSLYSANVSYGGFPSYYPASSPQSSQSRATYSPQYGQILPNFAIAPVSKAYITDLISGTLVFPPNIVIASPPLITPTIAPYSIQENDVTNLVDGDGTTYWRRNVYFSTNQYIGEVQTTLTITLPEQYVNNLTCNYLVIHPYPEFGIDISSIILYGIPGSSPQQLLQTDTRGNVIPISKVGKTRIIFPDIQTVSIDITFSQTTANTNLKPGLQAFTIGASTIDFGYLTFNQSTSTVLIPFTLQNNFFSYIAVVNPIVDGINYNLYYLDPGGDIVPFNLTDTLPSFITTIYVEVAINPLQGVLPVIDSITVDFLPVYLLN